MSEQATAGVVDDFLGYRPEELVGRGGMGVVYRARDLRLKRTVALKLMAPELAADERFRERFEREAELAMALEHPNAVPIHDAGELDGRLYLVMRFVEGTDLRTLLRAEGALEPRRALRIVSQVANALDAAHTKGLVHRDVKPSNILLDANEHAYLADFGLTRRLGDGSAQAGDGRSLGTPAYLAPEQIEGRTVDGRADVYSLGCLLYECLTGEPPFAAPSRLAVAWAHLEEDPPSASERNPHLPDGLDAVLRKAMAKEPDDRYATCGELVVEAEAALGLSRARSRRRRALLALAVVTVAAALAVAVAAALGMEKGAAEGGPLEVERNTLVRVDPQTSTVTAVIAVGQYPQATAVFGHTVWVYNLGDSAVAEIDAVTNEVRHTTAVSTTPSGGEEASVLAADAGGAWLVGFRPDDGRWLLTRILRDGGGKREIELGDRVDEVVAAAGSVWVLGHRGAQHLLIRVDPRTGTAVRLLRLPPSAIAASVAGLSLGGGYAWVRNEDTGTLYRVDLRTGAVRARDLGVFILRPVFGFGRVWACVADGYAAWIKRIDPRTMRDTFAGRGLPSEGGTYAVGLGSVWRHDVSTGTLMRFDPGTGDLLRLIRILRAPGAATVTSIAAGADAVWIAVS